MKFCKLIEYSMRNIFVEKSYTKYDGEITPTPISKISKLIISLDQQSEILCNLCLWNVQVEDYQNYEN